MEPLQVLWELDRIDCGLQSTISVPRHHILDDRTRLVDRNISVIEDGDPAQGMALPVLDDGDVSIYESGAIVEYVMARHGDGGLKPAVDSDRFAEYLQDNGIVATVRWSRGLGSDAACGQLRVRTIK